LVLFCWFAIPVISQDYSTFEAGPVFSTIFLNQNFNQYQPQLGGRLTFNVNSFLAIDSELSSSLRNSAAASTFDGGYALQFLAGVKATRRFKKWGVFAKARPGLISYSRAIKTVLPVPPFVISQRIALFDMDIGGGIEFAAGRRLVFGMTLETPLCINRA